MFLPKQQTSKLANILKALRAQLCKTPGALARLCTHVLLARQACTKYSAAAMSACSTSSLNAGTTEPATGLSQKLVLYFFLARNKQTTK